MQASKQSNTKEQLMSKKEENDTNLTFQLHCKLILRATRNIECNKTGHFKALIFTS